MQSQDREGAAPRCKLTLNANAVMAFACLLQFAGCTAMAPGIQFAKAPAADAVATDYPRTEIRTITPDLVRKERELRDQQVAEDIGTLLQPAQAYRIEAGDMLHIVVWDHPELSASMLPAPPIGAAAVAGCGASQAALGADGLERPDQWRPAARERRRCGTSFRVAVRVQRWQACAAPSQ